MLVKGIIPVTLLEREDDQMKRIIALVLVVIFAGVPLIGCGGSGNDTTGGNSAPTGNNSQPDNGTDNSAGNSDAGANAITASEFYGQYSEAKYLAIDRLSDGLSNNDETVYEAMSILGLIFVDLATLPATTFGLGQPAAEASLGVLGAKDVQYTENGNSYLVTYSTSEGQTAEVTGDWNPEVQSLICTTSIDGKQATYTEIYKTDFGFISQDYVVNDDGSSGVFQLAVQGEDGVVGVIEPSGKAVALNGSESLNFPKAAPQWYEISGDTITGVASDGTELNFQYIPIPEG